MGKRIAALVLAACMALPLFGCGSKLTAQSLTEGVTARTIDTHIDLTDDSTAVMDFAAALLRQTTKEEGVLLSPVSLLYALGMTANGAGGTTLSQLEKAMGMDRDTLNDYLYTYRMSLPENTKKCKLSLANSLWVRDIFRVEDSFLDNCVSYYDTEVYRSAFDEAMKNDLNHWVSNQTDGMIDKLLEQAPGERTMLYLVNAVCFDAKWEKPYEKDDIQKGAVFTAADGTRQTADLLWSQESLYLSDDNTTGFMKYYDGGRYAFVGLLPNEGVSIADYGAGLSGGKLHALDIAGENALCVRRTHVADADNADLYCFAHKITFFLLFDGFQNIVQRVGSHIKRFVRVFIYALMQNVLALQILQAAEIVQMRLQCQHVRLTRFRQRF